MAEISRTGAGVVYIVFGERFVREAIHSANSLKRHSDLPVTIFTDVETAAPCFDRVRLITTSNRRPKVEYLAQSPYLDTLYLDSDTQVNLDITELFGVLDRFDIAAVQDNSRKSRRWADLLPEYDSISYAFPEYNGGVMLYRSNERTLRFLELWRFYHEKYLAQTAHQDQASLRIALYESDVRLHTLPVEYNVRNRRVQLKMAKRARAEAATHFLKPRILHWHGLDNGLPFFRILAKFRPMRY